MSTADEANGRRGSGKPQTPVDHFDEIDKFAFCCSQMPCNWQDSQTVSFRRVLPAVGHMHFPCNKSYAERRRQRSKNNVAAKSFAPLSLRLWVLFFYVPTTAMWQIHKFAKNVAAFQKIWAGNLKLLCAAVLPCCLSWILRPSSCGI